MEPIDQKLIERYLAGELNSSERSALEDRAAADPKFRNEFNDYKLAIEALKLSQREELKNRFRQRDKMLDRQLKTEGGKSTNFYVMMMVAAGLISVLIAWYFLYAPEKIIDQAKNDGIDTTHLVQNPPVIIDTIKTNAVNPGVEKENESTKSKNTTQQIFAENFEPYKDESLDPTSRSGNNLQPFEKFQLYYWEGNAKNAYAVFDSLKTSDKQNDNLRFLYANVLMSLNRTQEAALILSGVIQNHKSIYTTEAKYYLALCNIKVGKIEEAKKNLKAYLADDDAIQKEKARKIIRVLE